MFKPINSKSICSPLSFLCKIDVLNCGFLKITFSSSNRMSSPAKKDELQLPLAVFPHTFAELPHVFVHVLQDVASLLATRLDNCAFSCGFFTMTLPSESNSTSSCESDSWKDIYFKVLFKNSVINVVVENTSRKFFHYLISN